MKIIVEDQRLQTFVCITFPCTVLGVMARVIFALIPSFNELIVPLFVSAPKLVALRIQIHSRITDVTDPLVPTVSAGIAFIIIGGAFFSQRDWWGGIACWDCYDRDITWDFRS